MSDDLIKKHVCVDDIHVGDVIVMYATRYQPFDKVIWAVCSKPALKFTTAYKKTTFLVLGVKNKMSYDIPYDILYTDRGDVDMAANPAVVSIIKRNKKCNINQTQNDASTSKTS